MPDDIPAPPARIYAIPPEADAIAHRCRWQVHIDTGRRGARLLANPLIAANAACTAAILSRKSVVGFRTMCRVSMVTFERAGVESFHA